MKKEIMQGNAAIARGAWEAGAKVAAAYPGTPSSEILKDVADNYPAMAAPLATCIATISLGDHSA